MTLRDELSTPATVLAPRLLGARLISGTGTDRVVVALSEVEAYEGADDPASHAFRGATARNAVMFGSAGHLYVYFVYGMHWCANLVCGPPGTASALLLRAGEVVEGIGVARARRPAARRDNELARGPARLAQCLGLTGSDNGADLLDPGAHLRIELTDHARAGRPLDVRTGPRVGVAAADDVALRFWISGDPTVSVYRPGGRKPVRPTRQTERP